MNQKKKRKAKKRTAQLQNTCGPTWDQDSVHQTGRFRSIGDTLQPTISQSVRRKGYKVEQKVDDARRSVCNKQAEERCPFHLTIIHYP
eukprot:6932225-Ditylum_brightwellii.AAC.1